MTKVQLEQDIKGGLRLADIAIKYGLNKSKIWRLCKKYKLSLTKNRRRNITKEKLAKDIQSGLRLKELTNKYLCSETTIWRRCKQFNITIPDRKYNLLNQRFGRLLVVEKDDSKKNGSWVCKCNCGNETIVKADHLIDGHTQSCGCLSHDLKWKGYGKISGNYWNCINRGAKIRNLEFSVTLENIWNKFLEQKERCALTGLQLIFYTNSKNKNQNQTASLDRIDSKKGYTIDNVQWIHKTIQKMKNDLEEEEFIKFCKFIAEFKK